jgi:hypothetical protein
MTIEQKHVDYLTLNKSALGRAQADTAEVKMSAVGMLTTQSANFKASSVAAALVKGDASLAWSSAQMVGSTKDVTLTNSGGQIMLAGNNIEVLRGGAAVMAARSVTVQRGLVGMVVAQNATLGDDTKVLLKPTGAAALGAGFGAGAIAGLLLAARMLGRRKNKD